MLERHLCIEISATVSSTSSIPPKIQLSNHSEKRISSFKQNCENFEAKLFELQKASNKHEQYTRRNNLKIHGIAVEVKDDQLEEKVIDIFSQLNTSISKSDIEDCHQLGKSIVRFINRKFCKNALEKKFEVNKCIDNSKFDFNVENKLFVCENETPYNQHLAWMCRELKRVKKVYN